MTNSILRILMKIVFTIIILLFTGFLRMSGVPSFISVFLCFGAIFGIWKYKPQSGTGTPNDNDPKLKK